MSDDDIAFVRSFGDVLRQIPPDHFPEASEQVQGAVTAALRWFVIEATELAANHCVGISAPPVPSVMLWADYELPVDKAVRPASFRPYVTRLRYVVELCERPVSEAFSALPPEERLRVRGGADSSPMMINTDLLGPLLYDFVYARAWLATFGTKAGYWSYRWVVDCLRLAAHESDASRAALAAALRQSAADAFHDALAPDNEQLEYDQLYADERAGYAPEAVALADELDEHALTLVSSDGRSCGHGDTYELSRLFGFQSALMRSAS